MMFRQISRSDRWSSHMGWAPAVCANDLVFVSACTGVREDGTLLSGVQAQVEQALENVRMTLEVAGTSFSGLLKTKLLLKDFSFFPEANEVYGRTFSGETRGTRSTIEVQAMAGSEVVAIEAVAALGPKQIFVTPGMKGRRPGLVSDTGGGGLVFMGGVVGNYTWDTPDWQYGPDVESQTEQMMKNLHARLEACGVSSDQVVRVLLLLNDRDDLPLVESIYRTHFGPDMLPTLTVCEIPSMGPVFKELVEIYPIASQGVKRAYRPEGIPIQDAASPVVRSGGFVFVSGMTGRGRNGELAPEIDGQTRQVLENVRTCLEAAGSSLDKIVRVLVFLRDIRHLQVVNGSCHGHLGSAGLPACTAVQMSSPTGPELITMEVIALA